MRFGKLELVRNQWRKFQYEIDTTGNYTSLPGNDPVEFNTLAVNLEENDQRGKTHIGGARKDSTCGDPHQPNMPAGRRSHVFGSGDKRGVYYQQTCAIFLRCPGDPASRLRERKPV